jgi:hypothetical protein
MLALNLQLTIHQPSFRVLELIHNFLVLARGNVVYHGSYASMPGYFEEFGRVVPPDVNVLEYALDAIEELQNSEEGLQPLVEFAVGYSLSRRAYTVVLDVY